MRDFDQLPMFSSREVVKQKHFNREVVKRFSLIVVLGH